MSEGDLIQQCSFQSRLRMCSSTNRRLAEERLPCWRVWSSCVTTFDGVAGWRCAISLRSLQKAYELLAGQEGTALNACQVEIVEPLLSLNTSSLYSSKACMNYVTGTLGSWLDGISFLAGKV